mmetsp:Transcript_126507/g.282843  ORF Transcript_126507/g.282843 Transcript_126507/m.282843 type:complete len:222 (-) Transcript_126507:10-675(-)
MLHWATTLRPGRILPIEEASRHVDPGLNRRVRHGACTPCAINRHFMVQALQGWHAKARLLPGPEFGAGLRRPVGQTDVADHKLADGVVEILGESKVSCAKGRPRATGPHLKVGRRCLVRAPRVPTQGDALVLGLCAQAAGLLGLVVPTPSGQLQRATRRCRRLSRNRHPHHSAEVPAAAGPALREHIPRVAGLLHPASGEDNAVGVLRAVPASGPPPNPTL